MPNDTDVNSVRATRAVGNIPVTVVVPVKNEEGNLPRCLASLTRFSEVIVVDSGSTDRTEDIARSRSARFIEFHWNGRYPKKRNWVLMNHALANDWVLFLDADEFISDEFCSEVAEAVRTGDHAGYWLSYTNYFLGQRLRFGLPQRKLALFKVGTGFYEKIDEDAWSPLDMEVHEHPILAGSVGEISSPIEHNDYRGIEKFLDRHQNYARWEARRILLLDLEGPQDDGGLTSRQRFKYRFVERGWYPLFYFVYAYFVRLGFLDGAAGFQYAFYKAWYFLTIRLLVRELRERKTMTAAGPSADQKIVDARSTNARASGA
jgi:glycosyltransferase involved in cell wall biosynthesis